MLIDSPQFLRAAIQRFDTAEFLLKGDFTLDAKYLTGYSIECAMKALIIWAAPETDRSRIQKRIQSGSKMHRYEILAEELKKLGITLPMALNEKFRRFSWSTELRYAVGRVNRSEVRAFLKLAQRMIQWVKEEMK